MRPGNPEIHEKAYNKHHKLGRICVFINFGICEAINQRTLEHLEWKLQGDFSKSKTIGDGKEAL